LSESGQRTVKTLGKRAGNDRFVPNTSLRSVSLASFCGFVSLLAVGCGNTGSGLADAARNISHRTRSVEAASAADAGDMAAEDDMASDDAALDEVDDSPTYDPTPNGPTSADGRKLKTEPAMVVDGPLADDSPWCGDGMLQDDELCDVAIPEGMPGACPTECEPLDACHAAKLMVAGCHSQCGLGDEVPCG
jgi:hypothetical protein